MGTLAIIMGLKIVVGNMMTGIFNQGLCVALVAGETNVSNT